MEFIVDELKKDSSRGNNFKILFEKEVTLEQAVDELALLLSTYSNNPKEHYVQKQDKYGHIALRIGELYIEDERIASRWLRIEQPVYNVYRVTENNMNFIQFENLYKFLEE